MDIFYRFEFFLYRTRRRRRRRRKEENTNGEKIAEHVFGPANFHPVVYLGGFQYIEGKKIVFFFFFYALSCSSISFRSSITPQMDFIF
jgi:hypothetical protein